MKISWTGITWGGPDRDPHWWYVYWWNWLKPEVRYWGQEDMWYDAGLHKSFGLWFINITWCTPWSQRKNQNDS